MAAETLAGAAFGARDRQAFRAVLRQASACAFALAIVIGIFYALVGTRLIDLLTNQTAIRTVAGQMLVWICISPLVSVWCFMLDGVFIGATMGRELRDGAVLALSGFVATSLILPSALGDHGLWLGFMVFMGLRGLVLALWLPRIDLGGAAAVASPT
jgi:MATE family multidrug resistance protein